MSDLNQCTFTGRLGADPEVKSFQNGGKVCNFRIAVGEQWKDKNSGERKERTEWVSVTIHNDGLIGVADRYLRKGSRVLISGKQQTRKWQAQDGSDRYSTECVLSAFDGKLIMLDSKPDNQGATSGRTSGGGGDGWTTGNTAGDDLDDDIPFITRNSAW
jgi:single-strand DNA-binding protein